MTLLLNKYLNLGGKIFYDHAIESFDQTKCETRFKNNEKYFVSHLAACDGIRSSIRDTFFTSNQKPEYSGYSAWRGIGKSNLQNIHFALGPNSHIVSYPINHDGDVSFVAVAREELQFKESWKEEGSYKDLLEDFSIYDSSIFPKLEDSKLLYKWGIYIRSPIKSMVSENITLLGDAAHPMVPFLGQGACMAIEDAYSFAMVCKKSIGNFADAQITYDLVRTKRTKEIQRLSIKQGKIYHMKNPALVVARNLVMRFTNFPGTNLKKIHEYDAHDAINMHLLAKEYPVDGGYN
jgi:salicylate hydroxylase